jgi:PadR family transcriptional regulator, regulatory protein PadR
MQQSQLVRGVLDLAVVASVAHGASYGYELLRFLDDAGFPRVSDASVYGTLKRLEEWGVLQSALTESPAGPARRTYTLTRAGKKWLHEAEATWRELAEATERLLRDRG